MLLEPIESTNQDFGAVLTGLDLRQPLAAPTFDFIADALARYAVVGIRRQPLEDDQQIELAERFGPVHQSILDESRRRLKDRRFNDVGNLDVAGNLKAADAKGYGDANLLWHTDLSFLARPARVTLLSARVLPPQPPATEYADMRAAWDALSSARQAELESLQVEHSVFVQRAKCGFSHFTDEERQKAPPVVHPLVRRHPVTGRRSLYLSSSASHLVGRPMEEGRALLEELTEFATQQRFMLAYEWQPYDLLMWGGSCTMHRATPFESTEHRRELRWTAVVETA